MSVFRGTLAMIGAAVALTVVVLLLIMYAAGVGIFAAHVNAAVAKRTLGARITTAIDTPDNAIANYERFFNECRGVVALGQQIDNLRTRYSALREAAQGTDTFGQKAQAAADALSDLTGAENQQASVAQTYNAQSAQYTRNQFKASSLPYRLDPPYAVECG